MLIKNFENLQAWQYGQDLAVDIYSIFRDLRDFGFKDQIQRAVISISNNIAEGFERCSGKELVRFLYIAKASAGEVRSMLYLAKRLGYLNEENFNRIYGKSIATSKLISKFIGSVKI